MRYVHPTESCARSERFQVLLGAVVGHHERVNSPFQHVSTASPGPPVRRANAEDRATIVRVLARAFDADPVVNYLLRQDKKRAFAFETAFDVGFCQLTLPFGETWIESDGRGAALWTPPGRWSEWNLVTSLYRLMRAIGFRRLLRILPAIERVQRGHPRQSHYYLFALGVDPAHQGRGIGSALLHEVLARCDAEAAAAYLEASTPKNARLYERHGFRVTEELRIAKDAPPLWRMWRDPSRAR
jgi:ribosomal protein S18 acetylase RimI-like enzyme